MSEHAPPDPAGTERHAELAERLARVEDRVAAACARAGRSRDDITMVVVTKTYPASDVRLLADLGVDDIGEARHPEAGRKVDACAEAGLTDLRWHFVGALQTNKASAVARYASLVHSVDRLRLVRALDRGAQDMGQVVGCLVQVDLDPGGDPGRRGPRAGAAGADVRAVADAVADADALQLRGVMAVAPLDADPAEAFARLAQLAAEVTADHRGADLLSAGMSGDLEQAVQAGATHLRVGRAVLGERPVLR